MTDQDTFDPVVGLAERIGPDLRRVLAPNPSPMTFRGTNTYLLGSRDLAVIDPGPDDDTHLESILRAVGPDQRITHIFVTHAHLDHAPLARSLALETGAPVLAFGDAAAGRSDVMQDLASNGLVGGGEGVDRSFVPDINLRDGEHVAGDGWRLLAHWTPGHFGNHMSFSTQNAVFTGDIVMGWASSLVSPPDGDLTDFMASCQRLKQIGSAVFHPGHGAPIHAPAKRLDWLMAHRRSREAAILERLEQGPATATILTAAIYTDTAPPLLPAAERNVLAHLIDLHQRARVKPLEALSAKAIFAIA